jgi:hypothetical protein
MYEKWTEENENALKEACWEDMAIGDTTVGRLEAQRKKSCKF